MGSLKNILDDIFDENIKFHRSSDVFEISEDGSSEWEIFLGGYPKGDNAKYFDFTLIRSGINSGRVKKCKIETDDGVFDVTETTGIIPSAEFKENLDFFGCDFGDVPSIEHYR